MSLKAFHLVFVAAAILLSLGAGIALVAEFVQAKDFGDLVSGLGFLLLGAGLVAYCPSIWRKFKEITRYENL